MCERRRTCPGEASAAPPCAQSLGCAPPDVELPYRSPLGHIPLSEPTVPQLLGACPHWCMYSASNNSEAKSTCSQEASFAPSYSPPRGSLSEREQRAEALSRQLPNLAPRHCARSWHGALQQASSLCGAAPHKWALARSLSHLWDFSEVQSPWREAGRPVRTSTSFLLPTPSSPEAPSLASYFRLYLQSQK